MKKILLSLCMLTSLSVYSQKGWVYTENKAGAATYKQCQGVQVTDSTAVFVVSGTSYQSFRVVGTAKNGGKLWVDDATGKFIHHVATNDGAIWWKTSKKAYFVER
jgi:hypothetical protein